jgi:hypothetical protein
MLILSSGMSIRKALVYLFNKGFVIYSLDHGCGWNSGYLMIHW